MIWKYILRFIILTLIPHVAKNIKFFTILAREAECHQVKEESNPIEEHYDLNHLSRESWQLELLVSGILLLLLFSSDEWAD